MSRVPSPESRVPSPEAVRYEASHEAMGTIYTVVAYGVDKTSLSEAVGQVFEEIDQLDDQMSNYKPESELSAINREAAQRDVTVSPELFTLIQYSLHASEASGGDFDITVGPLMNLWGFFRGQGRLPAPAAQTPHDRRRAAMGPAAGPYLRVGRILAGRPAGARVHRVR